MTQRTYHYSLILLVLFSLVHETLLAQYRVNIRVHENEHWWSGIIFDGHLMPLQEGYHFDMERQVSYNQLQPLLISDQGRYVFSEQPFLLEMLDREIQLTANKRLEVMDVGYSLKDAYQSVSRQFMDFSGQIPDSLLVTSPQYNTWIELTYNQNQEDILQYAHSMLKNGMPPGVMMIDDTWQHDYGVWEFDRNKFEDPKMMMDSLHNMGFRLMLWICPFVSPDSREYRLLEKEGGLLMDEQGNSPQIVRWWNGKSAVLDLSHPNGEKWLKTQLDRLQTEYGVDGFKFDGGDIYFYLEGRSYGKVTAHEQCELYSKLGENYPLNEYRASWKMGGRPIAQRLADKTHQWGDLVKLIPQICLQGIMGYPFACPDMIGGGEYGSFENLDEIDQELVVRSAQCHVFMPMMQFSVNPFRVLNAKNAEVIREAVTLRQSFAPMILQLCKEAAVSGEPVVRFMEYVFPRQGFAGVKDQFMLGANLLVAPVLEKNAMERKVILPEGRWKDPTGKIWEGGNAVNIKVDIHTIPYFQFAGLN